MTNPLSNLKIDYWYKAVVVLAAFLLVISLTVELIDIENTLAQLICLGVLLIGIGEWINHPLQTEIVPPNTYRNAPTGGVITGYNRQGSLLGICFDILGFIFIAIGVCKLIL